ncbi:hypothetical protein [Streptomyces rubrogriseus]|uniref:hypothetical protein n=1 Tax=Streptomyces rubrogriseus TaxID=194673 RepID=UPI001C3FB91E|nr:hypothetical protein [Streptomyces rubrogriseus]
MDDVPGPAGNDLSWLVVGAAAGGDEPSSTQPEPAQVADDRASVDDDAQSASSSVIRRAVRLCSRRFASACWITSGGVSVGLLCGVEGRP